MIQRFHSIHDIDPEFVINVELLLEEDIPSFKSLVQIQDLAPQGCMFTYFLFFGPTQNAPVGFAQLCLKPVSFQKILPWHKKINFWDKTRSGWKQLSWQIGDGFSGLCVFNPKFLKQGKEALQSLLEEYEIRDDIVAEEIFYLKGFQEFHANSEKNVFFTKDFYVLDPIFRVSKNYQEYLETLDPNFQHLIKENWRNLHQVEKIKLGDYSNSMEIIKKFPPAQDFPKDLISSDSQILTFEKGDSILGFLLVIKGKNGNIFFDSFSFESSNKAIIKEEHYVQYAVFKFYEMEETKKCHLLKSGKKYAFETKNEMAFYLSQGFGVKTVVRKFKSHIKELSIPL